MWGGVRLQVYGIGASRLMNKSKEVHLLKLYEILLLNIWNPACGVSTG